MPNFRDAVRRSFLAKLAAFLQGEGSRNLAEYVSATRTNEVISFTHLKANQSTETVTYGLVEIQRGDQFFLPGVNILFLDEIDLSRSRTKNKEYRLPARVYVLAPIEGNINPNVLATETNDVMSRVLECLEDGLVPIWDFSATGTPYYTGYTGNWHGHIRPNPGYAPRDESSVPEGIIGQSVTVFIDYKDFTSK